MMIDVNWWLLAEEPPVWTLNNWFLSLGSLGETLVGLSKRGKKALLFICVGLMGTSVPHYLMGTIVPIRLKPLI